MFIAPCMTPNTEHNMSSQCPMLLLPIWFPLVPLLAASNILAPYMTHNTPSSHYCSHHDSQHSPQCPRLWLPTWFPPQTNIIGFGFPCLSHHDPSSQHPILLLSVWLYVYFPSSNHQMIFISSWLPFCSLLLASYVIAPCMTLSKDTPPSVLCYCSPYESNYNLGKWSLLWLPLWVPSLFVSCSKPSSQCLLLLLPSS